jgi:hypothetical protein
MDYDTEVILSIAQSGLRDSMPELDRHAVAPTNPLSRLVAARIALRAIVHRIEAQAEADKENAAASYHGVPLEVLSDHELAGSIVPCEVEP